MTIEEKLKNYILSKHNSVREFTIQADIPYTTLASVFNRGIGNSSVNTVIKICRALNISADELADGNIIPYNKNHNKNHNKNGVNNIIAPVEIEID